VRTAPIVGRATGSTFAQSSASVMNAVGQPGEASRRTSAGSRPKEGTSRYKGVVQRVVSLAGTSEPPVAATRLERVGIDKLAREDLAELRWLSVSCRSSSRQAARSAGQTRTHDDA
jgi:hypothetical protein